MDIATLRPFWVRDIDLHTGKGSGDFKHWIANDHSFLVNNIVSRTEFSLLLRGTEMFKDMLLSDASRMACAAIETVHSISQSESFPKSWSWAAIKLYYAAFFSAHAIMRVFGVCCTQLEAGHLRIVHDLAQATGVGGVLNLSRGFYIANYDQNTNLLGLSKLEDTHGDTWKCFRDLLDNLSSKVLSSNGIPERLQDASNELSGLARGLENNGQSPRGNWLSQFRNDLNYKHSFDAWFPYGRDAETMLDLISLMGGWRNAQVDMVNARMEKRDVKRFFRVAISVVQLCKALLEDLDSISEKSSTQLDRTFMTFLRLEDGRSIV